MLQAMASCRAVREYFSEVRQPPALAELFGLLGDCISRQASQEQSKTNQPIDPSAAFAEIIRGLAKLRQSPIGNGPSDTGEYMHVVLDAINSKQLSKIFAYAYAATIKCAACETESKSPHDIGYALEMPGVFDLGHLLAHNSQTDNYACAKCAKKTTATRRMQLSYAPQVFVLMFVQPVANLRAPLVFEIPGTRGPLNYSLRALIQYTGGHYYADCMRAAVAENGEPEVRLMRLDDAAVREVTPDPAARTYFVFYERS